MCQQASFRWVTVINSKHWPHENFLTSDRNSWQAAWPRVWALILGRLESYKHPIAGKWGQKSSNFFINTIWKGNHHTSNALGSSNLTTIRGEVRQMTNQDFAFLRSLINTLALTSYDIDVEGQTCSCRWGEVIRFPCSHVLMVLREQKLPTTAMNASFLRTSD